MLKQKNSYKFVPALATTMLCICTAQAVNFHFGFNFPILSRPVYPVYTVPVYRVHETSRVRTCFVIDNIIDEIKHDLREIDSVLHNTSYADLHRFSHAIKNSWHSWISGYMRLFGVNRAELEMVADEVRDIRFESKRIQRERRQLLEHEYIRIRTILTDLTDIMGVCSRYRTSDLHNIIQNFAEIRRILVRV